MKDDEGVTAAAHGASPIGCADVGKFKHTPGPWRWYGNTKFSYYLATTHSGRLHVMGFQRKGMQYAEPTFRTERGVMKVATHLAVFEVCPEAINQTDPRVYRQDIIGFRNGDAALIAKAPELYDALLAAKRLCDNIYEFGHITDHVILDGASEQIDRVLSSLHLEATSEPSTGGDQ